MIRDRTLQPSQSGHAVSLHSAVRPCSDTLTVPAIASTPLRQLSGNAVQKPTCPGLKCPLLHKKVRQLTPPTDLPFVRVRRPASMRLCFFKSHRRNRPSRQPGSGQARGFIHSRCGRSELLPGWHRLNEDRTTDFHKHELGRRDGRRRQPCVRLPRTPHVSSSCMNDGATSSAQGCTP